MTDQNPNPNPSTPSPAPASGNGRDQNKAERKAARDARGKRGGMHSGWFIGLLLIALGVIFLLQNLGIPVFQRWWALLILIPAFWAFVAAWDGYQGAQRLNRAVAGSLMTGLILTLLAGLFLFDIALGLFWPVVLILVGLAIILIRLVPK